MKLKVKKIDHPGVTVKPPSKATQGSAGLDLYAAIATPVTIPPQGLVSIPTGIAVEFPGHSVRRIHFCPFRSCHTARNSTFKWCGRYRQRLYRRNHCRALQFVK